MKIWGILKTGYSNNKAQSLTELAIFGSMLLLVLSALLKYGMQYNHHMDLKMRTFRQAMSDAYHNPRPDADAWVITLEDKHIPDPADRFGVGQAMPMQESAKFIWGNTLQQDRDDVIPTEDQLPRVKYMINPESFEDLDGNGIFDNEPLTSDASDHDGDGTLERESFTDENGNGIWDHEPFEGEGTISPDGTLYGPYEEIYWPSCDPDRDGIYEICPGCSISCPITADSELIFNSKTHRELPFSMLEWPRNGKWDHTYEDADGDNEWDYEPFADTDGDGYLDQDPFIDTNGDGVWGHEPFTDTNGNGVFDGIKEYTIASYPIIWNNPATPIYTQLPGRDIERISWDNLRIYRPDDENEASLPWVMYLSSNNEVDILSVLGTTRVMRSIVAVYPSHASHGDAVGGILIADPGGAELNTEYFASDINADLNIDGIPDVNPTNFQGLILNSAQANTPSNSVTTRSDSIKVEEGPAYSRSTDQVNAVTDMPHTIRRNDGGVDTFPSRVDMGKGMGKIWETPK